MPTVQVERLSIFSGDGIDTITVNTKDNVNAHLFVDAGNPSSNPPNGDQLLVFDASGNAQIQNQPGGAVANSGTVFVTYRKTTGNQTVIDYVNVEVFKRVK
jgi:hypothetical protein